MFLGESTRGSPAGHGGAAVTSQKSSTCGQLRKEGSNCTAHIRNIFPTQSNLAQSHSRGFGPPESSVLPPYNPHPAHKCPGVRGNGPRSSKRDFPHGRGSPHWAPKSCVSRWGCYYFGALPGEHANGITGKGQPYIHVFHPAKLIRRD